MKHWLLPINLKNYPEWIKKVEENEFILQHYTNNSKNISVGDIVFVYFSNKEKYIKYVMTVSRTAIDDEGGLFYELKKHLVLPVPIKPKELGIAPNNQAKPLKPEYQNMLTVIVNSLLNNTIMTNKQPLNQILYGPPGTGKTYNTIYKALDILEPKDKNESWSDDDSEEGRTKALNKFNALKGEGRIVMTTFHQSMSYEDFVEGIKPITKDKDKMLYETMDGIFKKCCTPNAFNILKDFKTFLKRNDSVYIESQNKVQTYKTTLKDSKIYIAFTPKDADSIKEYHVSDKDLVHYLLGGAKKHRQSYAPSVAKYIREWVEYPKVLIIDEINRGNVANIFGELITLIEDDKRTTKWDEDNKAYVENIEGVKVKLPYSGQEFGVPGNLYIIGTMNTADRSVEALDSALRRRFSFTEMMPKPKLLEKVAISGVTRTDGNNANLADLLYTINKRIEILKDREHQIGHSYFMKFVNEEKVNAEELRDVFYNKIIPLLQEYFYGDYENILKVLSPKFITKESKQDANNNNIDFFANIGDNEGIDKPTDLPYTIKDIEKDKFADAISSLKLVKYPEKNRESKDSSPENK